MYTCVYVLSQIHVRTLGSPITVKKTGAELTGMEVLFSINQHWIDLLLLSAVPEMSRVAPVAPPSLGNAQKKVPSMRPRQSLSPHPSMVQEIPSMYTIPSYKGPSSHEVIPSMKASISHEDTPSHENRALCPSNTSIDFGRVTTHTHKKLSMESLQYNKTKSESN